MLSRILTRGIHGLCLFFYVTRTLFNDSISIFIISGKNVFLTMKGEIDHLMSDWKGNKVMPLNELRSSMTNKLMHRS